MLYDEEKTKDILTAMITQLRPLIKKKERILVAVDGRCGAGKTTLTRCLQKELDCFGFHWRKGILLRVISEKNVN